MANKSRQTTLRSDKFQKNVTKRGLVQATSSEEKAKDSSNVSPYLFGFLLFIFVGSTLFQIVRNAQGGPIF